MNNSALLPLVLAQDKEKKILRQQILKKRQTLIRKITKTEMLRVELEMIKQEYDVRIGRLYLKSNQQDLDIIFFHNLLELMSQGHSYEEAEELLHDTYYAKQRSFEEEQERLLWEKTVVEKREESQEEENELKKLWKYLVSKFHPDLVLDEKEKKKREEIMKKINLAYQERNYSLLQKYKQDVSLEHGEESSLEQLTEILIDIENQIIEQDEAFEELKASQWFAWKQKLTQAKKRNIDLFSDMEQHILNEYISNKKRLEHLKQEVEAQKNKIHSG